MNDTMSLKGRSVLVVDDDFYLAMDASAALTEVGAAVIGPFGRVDDVLASLKENRPEMAVIDANLGSGPSFDLVRELKDQGVPTLIVTGYDKNVIPPELSGAPCLQKPVGRDQLISAVSRLLSSV
jgi:DNA-binding NtrC family response regulator